MSRKLVVTHVYPPIPYRGFDWMAYDDDEAENPKVVGWGKTEWEAIHDYSDGLRELTEEQEQSSSVYEDKGQSETASKGDGGHP